jgi:hypothetical protein
MRTTFTLERCIVLQKIAYVKVVCHVGWDNPQGITVLSHLMGLMVWEGTAPSHVEASCILCGLNSK